MGCPRLLSRPSQNSVLAVARVVLVVDCQRDAGGAGRFSVRVADRAAFSPSDSPVYYGLEPSDHFLRWLFSAMLMWNTALVLSRPTQGNHYFVDLVAGAVKIAMDSRPVRHPVAGLPRSPRLPYPSAQRLLLGLEPLRNAFLGIGCRRSRNNYLAGAEPRCELSGFHPTEPFLVGTGKVS